MASSVLHVVLLLSLASCFANGASLSVAPTSILPGQKVRIKWKAKPGSRVIRLGVGRLPISGNLEESPSSSITIAFLFDSGGRIEFHSTNIEVRGVRGSWPLPDRSEYSHPFSASIPGISFETLCNRVVTNLQSELGFDQPFILADLNPDGSVRCLYFQTNWRRIADMQRDLDQGVKERLLTYLLKVENPGDKSTPIGCEVRMNIQNRRASDEVGEIEQKQNIYDQARQIVSTLLAGIREKS